MHHNSCNEMHSISLPYFFSGTVAKGFGRGSKEIGVPTANFSEEDVNKFQESLCGGIYLGWAQVNVGPVNKMVMSVGWNPFYKNEKKAVEVHILHSFKENFYGAQLKICLLKFLRPEKDFPSLDALIKAINNDIDCANTELNKPEMLKYKEDWFFSKSR